MFPAALRLLPIKDLKALRVSLSAGDYRHAGPNGPEEVFFTGCVFSKSRAGSLAPAPLGSGCARTTAVKNSRLPVPRATGPERVLP